MPQLYDLFAAGSHSGAALRRNSAYDHVEYNIVFEVLKCVFVTQKKEEINAQEILYIFNRDTYIILTDI